MGMTDQDWMAEAIMLAKRAEEQGEVPVGALVVSEQNQLLGRGYNQMITRHDPTAHAEIVAIRQACEAIHNYRIENTTVYVTLEPCPMCAAAMIHARIKRLVFATRDFKSGAAGSACNLFHHETSNHLIQLDEGLFQSQAAQMLSDFFRHKR